MHPHFILLGPFLLKKIQPTYQLKLFLEIPLEGNTSVFFCSLPDSELGFYKGNKGEGLSSDVKNITLITGVQIHTSLQESVLFATITTTV